MQTWREPGELWEKTQKSEVDLSSVIKGLPSQLVFCTPYNLLKRITDAP